MPPSRGGDSISKNDSLPKSRDPLQPKTRVLKSDDGSAHASGLRRVAPGRKTAEDWLNASSPSLLHRTRDLVACSHASATAGHAQQWPARWILTMRRASRTMRVRRLHRAPHPTFLTATCSVGAPRRPGTPPITLSDWHRRRCCRRRWHDCHPHAL